MAAPLPHTVRCGSEPAGAQVGFSQERNRPAVNLAPTPRPKQPQGGAVGAARSHNCAGARRRRPGERRPEKAAGRKRTCERSARGNARTLHATTSGRGGLKGRSAVFPQSFAGSGVRCPWFLLFPFGGGLWPRCEFNAPKPGGWGPRQGLHPNQIQPLYLPATTGWHCQRPRHTSFPFILIPFARNEHVLVAEAGEGVGKGLPQIGQVGEGDFREGGGLCLAKGRWAKGMQL